MQSLKHLLSCVHEKNNLIFPCLSWAGCLKDWPWPSEGERPSAYIVILHDTEIYAIAGIDYSIAAQSIMLGATELRLGGCMIESVDRKRLRKALGLSKRYEILFVLALGRPKEKAFLKNAEGNDIRYWLDSRGGHHVPKRSLKEIVIW